MNSKLTIIDVAQLAGVSIKTVSRVINDERYVSQATRSRVRKAIAELGFEPDALARGMRSQKPGRSLIIAHLYGDPGGLYTNEIQLGVLSRCRSFGYHMIVEELDYQSPDSDRRARELLRRLRPDGAVLTAPITDDQVILDALTEAKVPYVRVTPLREARAIPSVRIDEERAAYQLTQHLISYGHTRIGFVRGLINHAATHLRYGGFERAMTEAGLTVDSALVEDGGFRYFAAIPRARSLLARPDRPTAIFASNDEMAAAVIKVAHEMGLQLPNDLSVVGFDDSPAAEMLWPSLTTVRQPISKLGAAAADLLLSRLAQPDATEWPNPAPHQILQHDIVLRSSTAPLRAARSRSKAGARASRS